MSEQSTKDVQVKGTKRDGVFDEYEMCIRDSFLRDRGLPFSG